MQEEPNAHGGSSGELTPGQLEYQALHEVASLMRGWAVRLGAHKAAADFRNWADELVGYADALREHAPPLNGRILELERAYAESPGSESSADE